MLINPDVVRTQLPEYQAMVRAGDPDAAALTHEESSLIAKTASDVAISLGLPLVIDAVGADDEGQFSSKVQGLVDHGYHVTVRYVNVPLEVAEQREADRASATGRSVPSGVLVTKHAEVSRGFTNIAQISQVRVEVYDNTGDEPILIAEGFGDPALGPDALKVHDRDRYHLFLEKAHP